MAVSSHTTKSINAASDGDNTVITGVASRTIRVISYVLTCATTAGVAILKSGASGTEHARFNFLLGGNISYSGGEEAEAFDCDVGASLVINNAAGVDMLGTVTYTIE